MASIRTSTATIRRASRGRRRSISTHIESSSCVRRQDRRYLFKREFIVAASSIDVQSGVSTTCYLPGPDTAERECWYINMGAVDKGFFTTEALTKAGH